MTQNVLLLAAISVLTFASVAQCEPGSPAKISPPLLKSLSDRRPVNVIIRFKDAPTSQLHEIVRLKGGILKQEMAFINSAAYRVRGNTLEAIAADPRVVWISADGAVGTPVEITGEQ